MPQLLGHGPYASYAQVMNITSKLMMSDNSAHLRLDKTMSPSDGSGTLSDLGDPERVTSFELDIPRYGRGEMCFFQKSV
jgi:hypothetical protein